MINPKWKKQYNISVLMIENRMAELEKKWRLKNGNNNPIQSQTGGYPEQLGNTSGNSQSQPWTEQAISGGSNQYPVGNGG